MYAKVNSATLHGIDARPVEVETDVSDGMPMFEMVGVLSGEVREAKERVRTAIRNNGFNLPVKRITVNFLPADIKKNGTGFDLAIAVSVLAAIGVIPGEHVRSCFVAGELGLNGELHPIAGILPMVIAAREQGISNCILPAGNVAEASLIPDIKIIGMNSIKDVTEYFINGTIPDLDLSELPVEEQEETVSGDFSSVCGQTMVRRACEVAACGRHNLLMIGPPGSGKSLAAGCIPSILPLMTDEEKLEVSKIYSVCGLFKGRRSLMEGRPFRSPHHTITTYGLTGGGVTPRPGEISLAHKGVLFLDELCEFKRETIEILRQPLEEKAIHISRVNGDFSFPADFMLVAAMNPCKCGLFPSPKCRCTEREISRYLGRISQPILDRMDICVEAPQLHFKEIMGNERGESSAEIRERVVRAQEIQKERYKSESYNYNSQIPADHMDRYCALGEEEKDYLYEVYETCELTARTCHKLLRVARTIADLSGSSDIKKEHLFEAVAYKSIDKKYWRGTCAYEFSL